MTRQHFATGIMAYLASPLWMAQLIVGIVLVLQARYIRPEYFTNDFSLFPALAAVRRRARAGALRAHHGVLLAPKILGLLLIAAHRAKTRRGCGGAIRLIALDGRRDHHLAPLAPIMMLIQSGPSSQILLGATPAGTRSGATTARSRSNIVRRHRSHTALGVITLFAAFADLALALSPGCRRRSSASSSPFRSPGRAAVCRSASGCAGSDFCARRRRPRRPLSSSAPTRSPRNSP